MRILEVLIESLPSEHFYSEYLRQDLEADNIVSFYFVDDLFDSVPSHELEYQCGPPNLHFFDFDKVPIADGLHNLVTTLVFKNMSTQENAIRRVSSTYSFKNGDTVVLTLDYIRNVMEKGPFQEVIGVFEGASAAAIVLMDELQNAFRNDYRIAMRCDNFFVAFSRID